MVRLTPRHCAGDVVGPVFWLRWSWRGLRQRFVQVIAIAAIIALGSGIYAGLGSTSVWRTQSLNVSFSSLHAHDLEVQPVAGLALPTRTLLTAVRSAGGASLSAVEARLVTDLPVRAGPDGTIPAAGVIVGVDLAKGVHIDRWKVTGGGTIGSADATGTQVLLDEHFAAQHHLPPKGELWIADVRVRYVGTMLSPEYLNTTSTLGGVIQGAATRAVIVAPLSLAQRLASQPGQVNDVVALVRHGVSVEHVATQLSQQLGRSTLPIATTVSVRRDSLLTQSLYGEVVSEQKVFSVFALLILLGAGFAAFNLTRRFVEAQRRDLGIAMSLGVPRSRIAVRPLALALEVAVAGVVLGVAAGWGIGQWVVAILKVKVPLPVWQSPWQAGLFVRAAVLGLAIPLAGSLYPVWRAVRTTPTDALIPPHLRTRRHRLLGLQRKTWMPGNTMTQAPLRRATIAPARSLMTILAIALVLAPLLAAFGATDSTTSTIQSGDQILSGGRGDRLLVSLESYQSAGSSVVTAVVGSKLVGASALGLSIGGYLIRGHTTVDVSIDMVDLGNPLAVPTSLATQRVQPGGIVISAKAASDLHVAQGGRITLRHPVAHGTGYRFADSVLPVRAVVASPYSFVAYMSLKDEPLMGLSGIVNTATVVPRHDVTMDRLQRSVSAIPGVAAALAASSLTSTMRDVLGGISNLFIILQVVIGLMALLVAYNSSKIGSDERVRENATMMAFGTTVRRVVLIEILESVLLGLVGIGLGIATGLLVLKWILATVFPAAIPELAVLESVRTTSYLITALIGVVATALAPLLGARRLRAMNLPDTLRYVE